MMRIVFSCWVLFLSGFLCCNQGYSQNDPDRYRIRFDASHPEKIRVQAQIRLEDSLLNMSPYGPMPERWPQFIGNLSVLHLDGRRVPVNRLEGNGWVLPGVGAGADVKLEYDVILEHEALEWPGGIDGVAYRRDWGTMASGRSLFVVNGKDKRDIQVSISIPEGWNLSTAWVPVIGEENTFRVADLDELMESFLFAGTHRETKITRNGFTLKFILGGDAVLREESRYIEVASGVMDYYINLMGGAPRPGPGGELNQSLVIISQSADVDGEVIGNHLSMFMNPSGDPMSQMMGWFMFAHEFFHLWNGKTLRFTTANTDWFKEGVSNYYTIKALHQTGFVSEEEVLAILNNLFYQRYIHDPGFGSLPPSEAANGFDKDNHWGLIYGGGLFAGIAMDMEIRFKTGNRRSLDDLMREFYREYWGTDNTIGQETILTCANRLSAMDFGPFMEAHINGIEPLSLAPYLQRAGAIVDDSNKQLIISNKQDKTALQKAIWAGFLGENKAADKNK